MGRCGCKDDPGLWEKRSKRDALSIEIAIDVLRMSGDVIRAHYLTAKVLFLIRRYLKEFTIESCAACSGWERCAPILFEQLSRIHGGMVDLNESISDLGPIARIPFIFPAIKRSVGKTVEVLADRVEDLGFVRDEEPRSALRDLAKASKEAGPKLADWRDSMDFLN